MGRLGSSEPRNVGILRRVFLGLRCSHLEVRPSGGCRQCCRHPPLRSDTDSVVGRAETALPQCYPRSENALASRLSCGNHCQPGLGPEERPERWRLRDYFGSLLCRAAEEAQEKPDTAIFRAALRMAACAPEDAVMAGDRLQNDILPAHELGMYSVWVRRDLAVHQDPATSVGTADFIVGDLSHLLFCLLPYKIGAVVLPQALCAVFPKNWTKLRR